jgi:hypothetical protein
VSVFVGVEGCVGVNVAVAVDEVNRGEFVQPTKINEQINRVLKKKRFIFTISLILRIEASQL